MGKGKKGFKNQLPNEMGSKKEIVPKNIKSYNILEKNEMDSTIFLIFPPNFLFCHEDENLELKRISDFTYLLNLSFIQFWSTLKFNIHLCNCIESFFEVFTNSKLNSFTISEPAHEMELVIDQRFTEKNLNQLSDRKCEVINKVFKLIQRMVEDSQFYEGEFFQYEADLIIYDRWLIDIPKIIDMISILHDDNKFFVKKFVDNVFHLNNYYFEDFNKLIEILNKNIFTPNLQKFDILDRRNRMTSSGIDSKELASILQLYYLLLDLVENISLIIKFFPRKAVNILISNEEIIRSLIRVIINVIEASINWNVGEKHELLFKNISLLLQEKYQECLVKFLEIRTEFFIASESNKILEILNDHKNYKNKVDFKVLLLKILIKYYNLDQIIEKLLEKDSISEESLLFHATLISLKEEMEEKQNVHKDNISEDEKEMSEEEKDDIPVVQNVGISSVYKKSEQTANFEMNTQEKSDIKSFFRNYVEEEEYNDEYDDTLDAYKNLKAFERKLEENSVSSGDDEEETKKPSRPMQSTKKPHNSGKYDKNKREYYAKKKTNTKEHNYVPVEKEKDEKIDRDTGYTQKKKSKPYFPKNKQKK